MLLLLLLMMMCYLFCRLLSVYVVCRLRVADSRSKVVVKCVKKTKIKSAQVNIHEIIAG